MNSYFLSVKGGHTRGVEKQRQEDFHEFKASLMYIESSRTVSA